MPSGTNSPPCEPQSPANPSCDGLQMKSDDVIASQADGAAALQPHLLRFEESSAGTRLFWMRPEAALPLSPLGLLSGHQGWPCYAACVGPQNAQQLGNVTPGTPPAQAC